MNHKQPEAGAQNATVKQAIDALRKHRRALFLCSYLLAVFGVVVVSLLPNQYKATTTILVDPQKIPERYVASTITSDPNAHLNTLSQQVLSTSRIEEIVDQLNLYPVMRSKKSREEVIELIRSKIKIELKQGSEQGLSSFSISYVDSNRQLVALVANQLAASFIEWNLKTRQQQALVTTQFLSNELAQAQKSLEEQESALQDFRLAHAGATPDQLDGNLQALSRLQAEVQSNMDAISRLDEERLLLTQTKKTVESRDPSTLSERGRLTLERNRLEHELISLRRQFTDTYPDVVNVKAQLNSINGQLAALPPSDSETSDGLDTATQLHISLISKQIDRHKEQILQLQRKIGAYQGKVQSVPVLETQLAELTRNYETSRQNYQSLLDKRLSAGMSEDLERKQQAERFTVLDPARTPEKPFMPKRLPFMAGAIAGSILLSAGLIIGLELLRGAVHSEVELSGMIPPKVPILGTIPPIASQADVQHARYLNAQAAVISVLASAALIAFLLKVRPIL